MAHPRMYQDHDPYLAELRSVCLSFPEAVEIEAWGRPTFRAGKKMFAVFEVNESHPYAGHIQTRAGGTPGADRRQSILCTRLLRARRLARP